jgi:Ca2+-binding RTX toxin-like protein
LLQGIPSSTVTLNDTTIAYDPATKDVAFTLDIQFDYARAAELSLDLGDTLGNLVALDAIGNLNMTVGAHLVLGFGVNLSDGTPFMLGNTAVDLDAALNGQELFFEVGVGSLKLSVGQQTATPETGTGCADAADSDGDGFANDGCPAVPDPETGDDCGDKADDDGDTQPDDGCGDTDDAAVDAAETGAQCAGDQNEVDNDEDGTADDGCPPDPPTAAQADGDPEGGADDAACAIDNTVSDDNADGDDLDGAVNDGCPARADQARVFLGGGLDLDLGDASGDEDTHYAFDSLSFTGGFSGTDQPGCDGLDVPGSPGTQPKDACAILPLYLDLDGPGGNEPAPVGDATPTSHHIEVAIEDLTDPTNIIVDYDTSQLEGFLTSQLVDLLLMESGLQDVIDVVRDLLESDLLSFSLPLIGGQGATAANIADNLEATIHQAVTDALSSGQNPLAGQVTAGDVQTVLDNLSEAIATATTNAGLTVTENQVVLGCSPGGTPGGPVATCDPTESAFNIVDVRFDQTVSGSVDVFDEQLAFDIGIPGLGLSGNLTPQGAITWEIDLGFGVSKNTGFYFATGAPDPEMAVDFDIRLSSSDAGDPPGTLVGTFGFLQVTAVDGDPTNLCTNESNPDEVCRRADDEVDPRSTLGAHFAVDVRDPDNDGALSFAELTTSPDFSDLFAFSFEAVADVNLHLETGFSQGAGLPKLIGDLHLDWSWAIGTAAMTSNVGALEPGPGSTLNLSIDELGLDVGSYISNFLKPIFSDIKRFTDPLKPVLDTISACIPVLSDLSGSCVSLLTLAETLNGSEGEFVPDFVFDVVRVVQFFNALPSPEDVPGNLTIPIGGADRVFGLNGGLLRDGKLDPSQARDAYQPGSFDNLGNLLSSLNGQPAVQGAGSDNLKASDLEGFGVTFPFLQEPAKLLGLLFGQDVDLIVWQPRELKLSFSYSQKFGPIWAVPPVFIELGGSVSVHGRFGIGYSTKGFRNIVFNDGGPSALLQGLFLVDRHPLEGGPDSNELELRGEIFANAQVSVLIFSAGAQGSIYLTIGIDLNDPNSDGRLEYDEAADIIRSTGNVLCIFNLNGKFGVRISVFAEVDLFFWSERWELTLADIVLYEFRVTCDPKPDPILAHAEGSTLFLHIGTRKDARGVPSIGDEVTAETFVVTQNPDGSMTVAALGFTQTFTAQGGGAITHVVGDAAGDDDHITLKDGTGDGNAKVAFTATSDLDGGEGNDELIGGVGANTLDGGTGNDRLTARDQIQVAAGAVDTINGGDGKDIIDSGRGADIIDGGAGDDRISAGPGGDTIVGGVDHDNIDGGRSVPAVGNNPASPDLVDTIWGDNKVDDNDAAGTGNDTIAGGDGNDIIRSGGGADRVDGSFGADTISAGGPAGATCAGGPIDDVLVGGPDADTVNAGGGNDIVVGGNTLAGEPDTGDVALNGEAGCDAIVGDNGTQTGGGLSGLSPIDPAIGGGDVINGGADDDTIHGQLGVDTIHGNDGNDLVVGDEVGNPPGGDDLLFGDAGEDTMFGGPGDDDVIGGADGADGDHLFGDDGLDFVLGDDGSVNRTGPRESHAVTFSGGGTKGDDLHGGADRDRLFGQGNSDAGAVDEVFGDGGSDEVYGDAPDPAFDTGDGMDVVHGNVGTDLVSGGNGADDVFGDAQDDHMIGGYPNAAGNDDGVRADTFGDHMFGGSGDDKMAGDDATITQPGIVSLLAEASQGQADLIFGETDDDAMYGELGDDDIYGAAGIDHAEGNAGDDDIFGESDDDDLIGGTTEASDTAVGLGQNGGQPDGSDNIVGGPGHDALLGDNGEVTRIGGTRPDGAPERTITLWDLDSTDLTLSGEEDLQGNAGNDDLYGGAEHDVISAHEGDDHGEGNAGNDDLVGGAGQDDLIGGTSGEVDEDGDPLVGGNHPDLDDTIAGGDGAGGIGEDDHDVACGDNCSIRRFAPDSGDGWARDDLDETRGIVDVIRRQIQLYDIGEVGAPAAAGTNAADTIRGEDDHDRLYGQGGDDTLEGGPVDDYVEGNDGHETVYGQGGQDDIVGGTGRTISDDPATAEDGRLDTNDDLFGGDGTSGVTEDDFDVLVGDNATVLRGSPFPDPDPGSAWQFNTFNASIIRAVFLYDVGVTGASVPADTNGADIIHGEANDDVAYGQGDGDTEFGEAGDDYLEGNEGADTIHGAEGNDDIIGGTGRINFDPPTGVDGRLDAGETLSGGPGFDVMAGDNAIIRRVLDGNGAWLQNTFNDGVQHERIQLLDIASRSNPNVPTDVSGGDVMEGNEHDDLMYGQGNGTGVPDDMKGNDGDDYMEGNAGGDLMQGNAQQDDMLGGTGRVNQDPPAGTPGRFDDADRMFGGADHDVMTGDNATITRPLTPLPAGDWQTLTYGHLHDQPDPSDDEFHDQVVEGSFTRFQRQIQMIDTDIATIGSVSGSDLVNGNEGDDELFGQFDDSDGNGIGDDANVPVLCDGVTPPTVDDPDVPGPDATPVPVEGDLLCGEAGEDAVIGDQATIVDVAETGANATTVSHNGAPFIKEPVRAQGQLTRQVTLTQIPFGGDDVALGGLDHDSIHTGAGSDLAIGNDYVDPQADVAFDIIFAGDGVDAAWGGPGHDHLWGGYEGDFLDVVPRTNAQFPPSGDPLAWFLFAADDPDTVGDPNTPFGEGYDGYRGLDLIYGGWAQDALQANEGGNGPVPGDRLIDWDGAYNAYYVCPPTFGEHITTRQMSPSLLTFLIALAGHDGATTVGTPNRATSSGFDELALVYREDIPFNANPAHPDTPGHFTCE